VQRVSDVIRREESDFFSTIGAGLERIERTFQAMQSASAVMVDGREAASLYQTYGVPPELFQAIAAERNLTFDWDGYRAAMHEHEAISGAGEKGELFKTGPIESLKEALRRTEFVGYDATETEAEVKGIVVGPADDDRLVGRLESSENADALVRVVLDKSPFYGEGGGQVGDKGTIEAAGAVFEVTDTQRAGELIVHYGKLQSGEIKEGMRVTAKVDTTRRDGIRRAHSATHILHHALQSTVGSHAQQQGSKVDTDWLRFDFTNQQALSDEQIETIESIVNEKVRLAEPVSWKLVPLADARKAGAMMLFGEKYPDPVRMVSMGEFSKELCGGTHLANTSQVGQFEVVAEESVSAGTRRVVALTGPRAEKHRQEVQATLQAAAKTLGCSLERVADQVRALMQNVRALKKQLGGGGATQAASPTGKKPAASAAAGYAAQRAILRDAARTLNVSLQEVLTRIAALQEEQTKLSGQVGAMASSSDVSADSLLEMAQLVNGTHVIVTETPGATPNGMRQWIDQVRKKSSAPVAVLLASSSGDDKVMLVAGLSQALVDKGLSAGGWISEVAPVVGGGGGGKADLAQAGGKLPDKVPQAIQAAKDSIARMLA
jgi:alanyl-tRNA synthetase